MSTPDPIRQGRLKSQIIRVAKAYDCTRDEVKEMLRIAAGDFDEAENCYFHLCRELDEGVTL